MRRASLIALGLGFFVSGSLSACGGDDDGSGPGDGETPSYAVQGTVLDFRTGQPVAGSATISTDGLEPPPTVATSGATFTIEGVPPHSVFHILAGSPPNYRATYNVATEVADRDLSGINVHVVSEGYLAEVVDAFGVTPQAGTSLLLARLVDEAGLPRAGIPASAFELPPGIEGPYFLGPDLDPAPELGETSASGYAVLFHVPVGLVALKAEDGSGYSMSMPNSPVAATSATLAQVVVRDGEGPILPVNVSFRNDVAPIFELRGCTACHGGGGDGKNDGGFHLQVGLEKMYREIAEELSPNHGVTRADPMNPVQSLLVTMPSRVDPPDTHPNITFATDDDPDRLTILAWITEGALNN